MVDTEEPTPILPIASVDAILTAADRANAYSADAMERIRNWLIDVLADAADRGRVKSARLTPDDMKAFERAYLAFSDAIDKLQDRDNPPPQIPLMPDGVMLWRDWLDKSRLRSKQRRSTSFEWRSSRTYALSTK